MANYSQQEGTSLSLALESTRQRFEIQMETIESSLAEKNYGKDVEPTLQKIMTGAIQRACEMTYLSYSRKPGPDGGPRVVSAELFARTLIRMVWMGYRGEVRETLDPIFRPDPLPEDMWYQEPLSPEQAEYLKMKAQNSQSAMEKGGVPVQVQKTVTPETTQSQAPVIPPKKPASVGKETVKSQSDQKPKNLAKTGKETVKSQSSQKPKVPSDEANANRLKWSDEAMEFDKNYTSSCMKRNEQSIADGTRVEPRIMDTFLQTGEDGVQVGEAEEVEYKPPPMSGKAPQPSSSSEAKPEVISEAKPEAIQDTKANVKGDVKSGKSNVGPVKPDTKTKPSYKPVVAPVPKRQPSAAEPVKPADGNLVLRSKAKETPRVEQPPRAELTRCCFQKIDCDQGASMHVWNEYLGKWATTNHEEEPWYIRVPADKDYLFFGEDGIDKEPLLSMCPRGAHLHSEYVGGNGDEPRMLRIGVYLKVPTNGPMIMKPAEGRITCGHEASMVSMFFTLVDWSIRVTMGVECQFSTLLKSHHLTIAHYFGSAMENVVATATRHAKDQLDSQARAEEAERSRQEESAREEAAKERHAKKLQDETAHIEKSTRDILRSYENDEVKCRQSLKILIAETDEFIQDDAQRWAIVVTYISRDWPDKADWASELVCKQGYGEARPT